MTAERETRPEGAGASGLRWVTLGLVLGVVLGGFFPQDQHPQVYELFRFCSKAFISLVKSVVVPILVSTIITGIAQTGDVKAVGRMGVKALLYFEVVTTMALLVGLVVGNVLQPGAGLPLQTAAHDVQIPPQRTGWEVALHAFPTNVVKHAAEGDVLPVVVFATLFGIALTRVGDKGRPVLSFFEAAAQVMFKYTAMVMALTPLGVFGAMAYNVSHMAAGHTVDGHVVRGWPAVAHLLGQYATMVGSLYLALAIFVALVFVPVLWWTGVGFGRFLRTVREPVLTAFSTASSESVLAQVIDRVGGLGVPRRVASFVIPAGYSFNLDGSTLYLVLATLAISQAAGMHLSLTRQLAMLFTFVLTSKGVAAVPRATMVIIAGTCASFGLPGEAGVAMLLAVDEVMDMARTATNVTGNALASVVIAKWEGVLGESDAGVTDRDPAA
ncbi:MAG: dicarboxylate/amino acid:cation symporter [Myxococcales bacterium]|nr:dicarboxylate/amino acid:cation symporter [Myxococcales bacterium]